MIEHPFFKKHPRVEMFNHLVSILKIDETVLRIQIAEFLKFIFLQSTKNGGFIPVTEEIDAIWHEYILQTREYALLCQDTPGQEFIHHQTITLEEYIQSREQSLVLKDMLSWIPCYFHAFGPFTDQTASYWTIVRFLMNHLSMTLEQINAFGAAH